MQFPIETMKDSINRLSYEHAIYTTSITTHSGMSPTLKKWKMRTAIGGGPVLLQNGEVKITNNEELKFVGKAINDKHPRTAMGYTKDGKLIILVIEGEIQLLTAPHLGKKLKY
jgi:exopolysaccharide biosynthesis protein